MLFGLIFRGIAFGFRYRSERMRSVWDWGFFGTAFRNGRDSDFLFHGGIIVLPVIVLYARAPPRSLTCHLPGCWYWSSAAHPRSCTPSRVWEHEASRSCAAFVSGLHYLKLAHFSETLGKPLIRGVLFTALRALRESESTEARQCVRASLASKPMHV
jgi:hypothetical protein